MRRIKIVLIVSLAAAALFCVVRLWPDEGLPRTQTLADGSVFKVESVSFGTNLSYTNASPKAWQLAIGKRLPYALASRLGWRFYPGFSFSPKKPDSLTGLAIFTVRDGPGVPPADGMQVLVLDEKGNSFECDRARCCSVTDLIGGVHYHVWESWVVSAYQRRGNRLLIRCLRKQSDGRADMLINEFFIHNPQSGPYPTWTPEPWPVTKNAGDMSVTLTDFTTGLSKNQPTREAVENEEMVTRLTLDIQAEGQTWKVNNVEISDATGNRWNSIPLQTKTQDRPSGATQTMLLLGNLWPGESAWKLRIELIPSPDVRPDEPLAFADLNLAPKGSNSPLAISLRKRRFVEFLVKPRVL